MRHDLPLLLAALLLSGPACSPDPFEDEIGQRSGAIMFGQSDPGHAAVGLLTLGASVCGGTLIASDAVLTAARCAGAGSGSFVVGGYSYPVTKTALHPGYVTGSVNYDFAVVTLGQAVTGVAPVTLGQTAPKKGDSVTIVGFGATGSGLGDGGYRRVTSNVVSEVQNLTFSFTGAKAGTGNICDGDAGGASFRIEGGQELLIGVHSAPSEPCGVAGLAAFAPRSCPSTTSLIDCRPLSPSIAVTQTVKLGPRSAPAPGSEIKTDGGC